jgi:putative hemolysin
MKDSYPSYLAVVLTLLGAVVVCGCMAAGGEDRPADRISGNGTITYVDLEGGFYGIVADDGARYLPTNLPEEYRTDGLRVAFVVDPLNDTATIQQWGTPVEIIEIEKGDTTRRTVAANGTITYVDLEGGFYGIVADDGMQYLPANLPEEYRTDGLRVAFSADPADDGAGIQMWGTPVEIRSIERIDGVLLVSGNATVTYIDLEGGFYGLVTDDGRHYLPLGLDETWRVDGTNVTFVAGVLEDTATIQQWGVPVEVIAIDTAGNATYVAETGTVAYIDLEGGFYGIIADDGMHYLPLGLEERYRVDGMRLTFAGEVSRDVMTVQQWGTPVEIIAVPWACARCGESVVGIANPAAVWCKEQGYAYEIRQNPDGSEYGVCIFENGTEVDAWDYYRQTH